MNYIKGLRKQNWIPVLLGLVCVFLVADHLHAAEVKESYSDGKPKLRYNTDAKNQKSGLYEEFFPTGKIKLRGQYALGKKAGVWASYDEKTSRLIESWTYRNDLLEGPYVWNLPNGKPGLRATYRVGQLYGPIVAEDEAGKVRRISYPRTREDVEKNVRALYFNRPSDTKFTTKPEFKAPYKAGILTPQTLEEALKETRLYRYLSGVPSDNLKIDPALSDKAAHAAVLFAKVDTMMADKLEKPTDMDAAFFKIAMAGNKEGIVHKANDNPIKAVRSFMADTEEKYAATVEQRQWMLSPGLLRTGFGSARNIVVMDTSDGARPGKIDYSYITFPGEGYYPKKMLDAAAPWSIFINNARAKVGKAETITITLQPLDEHYQVEGNPIETKVLGAAPGANPAFGWSVISFKPELETIDTGRFWVQVQGIQNPAGADVPFGYLVDIIDIAVIDKVVVSPTSRPAEPTAAEKKQGLAKLVKTWIGKTIPDVQFSGRRVKNVQTEADNSATWKIEDPGEPTIILAMTDPSGKIVGVTIDGTSVH